MIFNIGLTHLGSETSIYIFTIDSLTYLIDDYKHFVAVLRRIHLHVDHKVVKGFDLHIQVGVQFDQLSM